MIRPCLSYRLLFSASAESSNLQTIIHHNLRHFGAGRCAFGGKDAVSFSADDAKVHSSGEGVLCPDADVTSVFEGGHVPVHRSLLTVPAPQDGHHLLQGDGIHNPEEPVAVALGDPFPFGPEYGVCIPQILFHIREGIPSSDRMR